MYVPDHFKVSEEDEIFAFIDANAFGQLVSIEADRPYASHLPFLIADDRKTLRCHLARQNPQWQQLARPAGTDHLPRPARLHFSELVSKPGRAHLELPGRAYLRALPGA